MAIGSSSGSNLISSILSSFTTIMGLFGTQMAVMRHNTEGQSDIYGTPLDTPAPFTVTVVVVKQKLDEEETVGGGKRKEILTIIGEPGTLLENDILNYSGHNYDVTHVGRTTVQSSIVVEMYTAWREVDI